MSGHSFVNIANARNEDQRRVMEDINMAGHCPFCPENIAQYHKKPILKEGEHWLVTENQWPYESTSLHLLLISKKHIEQISEVVGDIGTEFWEMNRWIEKEHRAFGGAVAMRFGSSGWNGSTVRHLHSHFIVPDRELAKEKPVRFKISG